MGAKDQKACAVLVPSLNRPHRIMETILSLEVATPENYDVFFAVSDKESIALLDKAIRDGYRNVSYIDDSGLDDQRYVTRNNALVREVRRRHEHKRIPETYATVFFGQDDVKFHPGWLEEALKVMQGDVEVVLVNDLRNQDGTAALMTLDYTNRAVFDQPGDVFHRGYQHNFADNEQHFTAMMRKVSSRARKSIVEHLNPIFGQSVMSVDSTYALSRRGWNHDAKLWHERRAQIEAALG